MHLTRQGGRFSLNCRSACAENTSVAASKGYFDCDVRFLFPPYAGRGSFIIKTNLFFCLPQTHADERRLLSCPSGKFRTNLLMGLFTLVMRKTHQQPDFVKNVDASYRYGEFGDILTIFNTYRINMS